jgi:hypothetical protein
MTAPSLRHRRRQDQQPCIQSAVSRSS